MSISTELKHLYGPVNNLRPLVHPRYRQRFKFLNNQQIIALAKTLVDKITASGYSQIVVSETGANPLAYVCERIAKQRGLKIRWTYLKFPRELPDDLFSVFASLLKPKERKGRVDLLRKEIRSAGLVVKPRPLRKILDEVGFSKQDEQQKRVAKIFVGTNIAKILSKPFLYFDEYIDSGTTLAQLQLLVNYLSSSLSYKIISYFIKEHTLQKFSSVFFSCWDLDHELKCYRSGIYPFENRLDLIGYFYCLDEKKYLKVSVSSLVKSKKSEHSNLDLFIKSVRKIISHYDLLSELRSNLSVMAVDKFMSSDHLVRYLLFSFEESPRAREFLWLLFDMYGPIWSPLPDSYHLDFWDGFTAIQDYCISLPEYASLKKEYQKRRRFILNHIAGLCLERQTVWHKTINSLLPI